MLDSNERSNQVVVILGLGANLSRPLEKMGAAIDLLREKVAVESISSVYITEPVGFTDQPDFHNLVLSGTSGATVYELHSYAHQIEGMLGRESSGIRNGPREIDIDLLAYGELVLTSADLTVPHPRMLQRGFVLVPLAEIVPGWEHPVTRLMPGESLAALESPGRVKRSGLLPGWGSSRGEDN